jgi:hypothetical protein
MWDEKFIPSEAIREVPPPAQLETVSFIAYGFLFRKIVDEKFIPSEAIREVPPPAQLETVSFIAYGFFI